MQFEHNILLDEEYVAGNVDIELAEIDKVISKKQPEGIHTISTLCGAVLTLICC